MTTVRKEITVILACRDQGRFLHPAVRSVADAIERAEAVSGVSVEWITVAAPCSEATNQYLSKHLPLRSRKITFAGADLSTAKNEAIAEASGRFIALINGDDLVSNNWLSCAFTQLESYPGAVVVHPRTVVVYGDSCLLYVTPDQEEPDFSEEIIFASNPWPATSAGPAEIYRDHPFVSVDQELGAQYPEWHWICQTVASGVVHKPVPGTLSCCRRQHAHACVVQADRLTGLLPSSRLFQPPQVGCGLT